MFTTALAYSTRYSPPRTYGALEAVNAARVNSKINETRVVRMNDVLYNNIASLRPRDAEVFSSRYNRPYRSVNSGFEAVRKRARTDDFTFHDVRHTFAL